MRDFCQSAGITEVYVSVSEHSDMSGDVSPFLSSPTAEALGSNMSLGGVDLLSSFASGAQISPVYVLVAAQFGGRPCQAHHAHLQHDASMRKAQRPV